MPSMTSVVEAERIADEVRKTGKYHYIGVYKSMRPEDKIFFSVQRTPGGEWERILDDKDL